MKKTAGILTAIILVWVIAMLVVLAGPQGDNNEGKNTQKVVAPTVTTAEKTINTCDILTPALAAKLIGEGAETQPKSDTKSDEIHISNCVYTTSDETVRLLARLPLGNEGIEANTAMFGPNKPNNVVNVSEYGDQAYWSAEFGQLHILKNNTWYILTVGSLEPQRRTLVQARNYADLVIDKL